MERTETTCTSLKKVPITERYKEKFLIDTSHNPSRLSITEYAMQSPSLLLGHVRNTYATHTWRLETPNSIYLWAMIGAISQREPLAEISPTN
jgi:hypothetical protein